MEKNFNDNELDRAFRQGMEDMDLTPSESFWAKSESNILEKENISIAKKLFWWKVAAGSLSAVVVVSMFYIFHLQNALRLKPEVSTNFTNPAINGGDEKSSVSAGFSPEGETAKQPQMENKLAENKTILSEKTFLNNQPVKEKQMEPIIVAKNNIVAANTEEKKQITTANKNKTAFEQPIAVSENLLAVSVPKTIAEENKKEEPLKADSSPIIASSPINNLPGSSTETSPVSTQANFLSRISVSGFFSPSIANQFLKDNNADDNLEEDDINESEEDQFAYSAGIKIGYDLKNNWSVNTGCNYFVSSYNINPSMLYAKQGNSGDVSYSLVTSSGVVEIPSDASTPVGDTLLIGNNSTQTLSFISIPLQFAYNHPVKRFIFYALAGPSANILLDSQTNLNYEDDCYGDDDEDDSFEDIEGLKSVHYGFSIGVGAKYMLTRKFFLSAEPSFSGALTSINKNVPIQSHPYFWGLGLGILYHF